MRKEKTGEVPVTIEQLKAEPYEMKYCSECKYIWKTYVPERGQCSVLQGEVLREIEKLRYEAQNNGNVNWDEGFEGFCRFIGSTLCGMDIYTASEKKTYAMILNFLARCGRYALKVAEGGLTEEDFDPDMIAHTNDNLYDILADAVGYWQHVSPEPVPYEHRSNIYR